MALLSVLPQCPQVMHNTIAPVVGQTVVEPARRTIITILILWDHFSIQRRRRMEQGKWALLPVTPQPILESMFRTASIRH